MMSSPAQHTDPFALAFQAMEDSLVERIAERLLGQLQQGVGMPTINDGPADELRADAYYDASFLAERYGYGDTKSGKNAVYAIPENELRRTRVGQGRGRTLFYGLDVMRYEGLITDQKYDALQKAKLTVLENPPKEPARLRRLGHAIGADQKPQTG